MICDVIPRDLVSVIERLPYIRSGEATFSETSVETSKNDVLVRLTDVMQVPSTAHTG